MLLGLTRRVLTETRPNVVAKFVYNFGIKGVRSVELHKRRRKRGENFPPFLFISIISSCQLRCQGCWVDVAAPAQKLSLDDLNRIIGDAKAHGNAYFGILGGEPFLHPDDPGSLCRASRLLLPGLHQWSAHYRRGRS